MKKTRLMMARAGTFRRRLRLAACACAVGLATGCSTVVERARPAPVAWGAGEPVDVTALAEALLARPGTRVEHVSGSAGERVFAADVVARGDGEKLTIVFLAPQMRLATLTLTRPHALRFERAEAIPRAFEPEYALADYAFTHLDAPTLRRACGASLAVADDGRHRGIALPDGTPVANVTRAPNGDILFKNLVYGYSYRIQEDRTP